MRQSRAWSLHLVGGDGKQRNNETSPRESEDREVIGGGRSCGNAGDRGRLSWDEQGEVP